MKSNDIVKFLRGVRGVRAADVKILLAGALLSGALGAGCSRRGAVDTAEIDAEIALAKDALDSVVDSRNGVVAMYDMYRHKRDSLMPAAGVLEPADERARKDAQWCQYRDSASKYADSAINLDIECALAALRVDSLVAKRKRMKMR